MKSFMLRRLATALITISILSAYAFAATSAGPDKANGRITISSGKFMVGRDQIWMNGANTPWHHWNDLGGDFDPSWWGAHLQLLHDRGINATRIWISCSGDVGIEIDENGHVSGATPAYWADLGRLLDIAQEHEVYVLATLMSFDHFNAKHNNSKKWRKWISTDEGIDSYIKNYLHPLLGRYGHAPRVWAIDLMNEPEWVFEDAEDGKISWERLQSYFARAASEIHRESEALVTIGMAMPKYSSDVAKSAQGNKVSDASLRAAFNDPGARLDFNSTHYYDWCGPLWGNALYLSPKAYGLPTDKPSIVGEFPARGTKGHTVTADYESAFQNGWEGAMGWTSNSVDSNGGISELGEATLAFKQRHADLVYPGGSK
jgi:hypothetical protein